MKKQSKPKNYIKNLKVDKQQKLNTIIYPPSTEFKVAFAEFNVGQKTFIFKYSRDAHFNFTL